MILTAMLVLFAVPAFYGLWLSTQREFMVLLFSFRPVVAYRALVVLCGLLAVLCTLWQLFCASSNSSCLYVRAAAYWLIFWFCSVKGFNFCLWNDCCVSELRSRGSWLTGTWLFYIKQCKSRSSSLSHSSLTVELSFFWGKLLHYDVKRRVLSIFSKLG